MRALPRFSALVLPALLWSVGATATAAPADAAPAMPRADRPYLTAPTSALIEGPTWNSRTRNYRCDAGRTLIVSTLRFKSGESFAILTIRGRQHVLHDRPTADGASRFVALDEQNSLRWYPQGEEGRLAFMPADHTAKERTLFSRCAAAPAQP